jgi:hypothetical protein
MLSTQKNVFVGDVIKLLGDKKQSYCRVPLSNSLAAKPSICKTKPDSLVLLGPCRVKYHYHHPDTVSIDLGSEPMTSQSNRYRHRHKHWTELLEQFEELVIQFIKRSASEGGGRKQARTHVPSELGGWPNRAQLETNAIALASAIARAVKDQLREELWGHRARTAPPRLGGVLEHGVEVVVAGADEDRPGRVVGHLLAAADEHVRPRRAHGQQRPTHTTAAHHHYRLHRRRWRHGRRDPSEPASRGQRGGWRGEGEAAERSDGDGGFECYHFLGFGGSGSDGVWFTEGEVPLGGTREPHDHGWAYLIGLWSTSAGRTWNGLSNIFLSEFLISPLLHKFIPHLSLTGAIERWYRC